MRRCKPSSDPRASSALRSIRPDFDWQKLACEGEAELRAAALAEDPSLAQGPAATIEQVRRNDWLSESLRLHPSWSPALARAAQRFAQVTHLEQVTLRIHPSEEVRAVAGADAGPLVLIVSIGLLRRMKARELLFWLGRAAARPRLDPLPVQDSAAAVEGTPSRSELIHRGLFRFQELTADRAGLLCCQDPLIACQALAKGICGLPQKWLRIDLSAFESEADAEAAFLLGDRSEFLALRMNSLVAFSRSDAYRDAFDVDGQDSERQAPACRAISADDAAAAPREARSPSEDVLPAPLGAVSARIEADLSPPAAAPSVPVRALRPMPGHPELFEEVLVSTSDAAEATDTPAAPPTRWVVEPALRSSFLATALAWALGDWTQVGPAGRRHIADLSLPWKEATALAVTGRGEMTTRALAEHWRTAGDEERTSVARDLLTVLTADGPLAPTRHDRLRTIIRWLGVPSDEWALLRAEFFDPEFADYAFQVDQAVEVQLDGRWIAGTVRVVEAAGDLRIHFPGEDILLRLSPRADLIRPAA